MLLDDLDRNFEIESAVDAEDATGIRPDDRSPAAKPRTTNKARDDAEAVLPDDAPKELVAAAERLAAAGYRISRADDGADFSDAGNGEAGAEVEAVQGGEGIPALSPRELQVLALLAEGAPNKVIARRLDISVHTAKFHVASIIAKLGAVNRTDAMATAMRMGLVGG